MGVEIEQEAPELILARATIAFGGIPAGTVVSVDPKEPGIAAYLRDSILVPTRPDYPAPPASGVGEMEGRTA